MLLLRLLSITRQLLCRSCGLLRGEPSWLEVKSVRMEDVEGVSRRRVVFEHPAPPACGNTRVYWGWIDKPRTMSSWDFSWQYPSITPQSIITQLRSRVQSSSSCKERLGRNWARCCGAESRCLHLHHISRHVGKSTKAGAAPLSATNANWHEAAAGILEWPRSVISSDCAGDEGE